MKEQYARLIELTCDFHLSNRTLTYSVMIDIHISHSIYVLRHEVYIYPIYYLHAIDKRNRRVDGSLPTLAQLARAIWITSVPSLGFLA
jgi:hypothetical protein